MAFEDDAVSEPARTLRRGGGGYYVRDAPPDPLQAGEALTPGEQQQVTEQARARAERERRDALEQMLQAARREADHLAALSRHAEKQVARLERRFRRA